MRKPVPLHFDTASVKSRNYKSLVQITEFIYNFQKKNYVYSANIPKYIFM